jgi:hypothetical protein
MSVDRNRGCSIPLAVLVNEALPSIKSSGSSPRYTTRLSKQINEINEKIVVGFGFELTCVLGLNDVETNGRKIALALLRQSNDDLSLLLDSQKVLRIASPSLVIEAATSSLALPLPLEQYIRASKRTHIFDECISAFSARSDQRRARRFGTRCSELRLERFDELSEFIYLLL